MKSMTYYSVIIRETIIEEERLFFEKIGTNYQSKHIIYVCSKKAKVLKSEASKRLFRDEESTSVWKDSDHFNVLGASKPLDFTPHSNEFKVCNYSTSF